MDCLKKQRNYKNIYCPHCNKEVSKSTWYLHHSQYYNQRRKTWEKANDSIQDISADFNFGPESPDRPDVYEDVAFDDEELEPNFEQQPVTDTDIRVGS